MRCINILFDFRYTPILKLLALVDSAELAPVPGAVACRPDKQRAITSLAGWSDRAKFKPTSLHFRLESTPRISRFCVIMPMGHSYTPKNNNSLCSTPNVKRQPLPPGNSWSLTDSGRMDLPPNQAQTTT